MSCYYPKPARRSEKPNENGKHPLLFSWKGSQLDYDFDIPCGKCIGCRADQSRDWGVRMLHESLDHERNCMVTLTYAPEHLPKDGKISKEHVQKWLKRLRKKVNVRFFAVGEYGEQTHRPHYHIAIFGEDFLGGAVDDGTGGYSNRMLDNSWKFGIANAVPLEFASCLYIAGYVTKKLGNEDTFAMQSRQPPLGKPWLEKNIHNFGNRHTLMIDGKECPIPKKYYDWFPQELDYLQATKQPVTRSLEALRNREKNHKSRTLLKDHKI